MTLYAEVQEDGMLIAKAPKSLWGKKVKIMIQEAKRTRHEPKNIGSQENIAKHGKTPKSRETQDNRESLAQWEKMSAILKEVDQLDIPRRTVDEILHDLHELRESK